MENATAQHSLRVHIHVAVWKHLNTSVLKPIGRGWELDGNKKLRPKMLTGCNASDNLLRNLLQLQGKREAVPNHKMWLHESWDFCLHVVYAMDTVAMELMWMKLTVMRRK